VSFVVRVVVDRQGQAGGVVERVATGGKEAFRDLEAIGRVLRTMLRDEWRRPPTGLGPPPPANEPAGLPERPRRGARRREGRRR
jgi:hypothetical protein